MNSTHWLLSNYFFILPVHLVTCDWRLAVYNGVQVSKGINNGTKCYTIRCHKRWICIVSMIENKHNKVTLALHWPLKFNYLLALPESKRRKVQGLGDCVIILQFLLTQAVYSYYLRMHDYVWDNTGKKVTCLHSTCLVPNQRSEFSLG